MAIRVGIGIVTCNRKDVLATTVPAPPLPVQLQLVERVSTVLSTVDGLRQALDVALARAPTLSSQILKVAFRV